ncbi:3-methyl-2-oxobutanoate hydroxymethyltransferase [Thermorudis peleae]|uniref:3-methyl-2-oxobutanoate hydroxymethyltransferase n=1 Tax=Thermorudis peleae TaxID=1382356 RepID=UPI00068FB925|nr:3-methyl-2-oxobutanoate hydroxymethyltransferase [Thermorudis peleae]
MRVTVAEIQAMKRRGERIPMLTAYDYATARLADQAGVPMLLVGDSLGMTILGFATTLPVTLEMILHHTQAVVRGSERALVVADMPFLTYQVTPEDALRNAGRLIQEGGAQAVKLEGGTAIAPTVARLVQAGIPVMGHLGLTPQSVNQLGGFRLQAKTPTAIRQLFRDALALQDAGVFALVLELIPAPVARALTHMLTVPTIGIGAGPDCDGQVQVVTDLLHLLPGSLPRHAKPYAELADVITDAFRRYAEDVRAGTFPTAEQSFGLPRDVDEAQLAALVAEVQAEHVQRGELPDGGR